MIIWGMMTWWYTDGWRQCLSREKGRLESTIDYFSISLLLGTLFSPFRQISAGQVGGSFAMQVQAFFDKLISRVIGAFVRIIMIAIGCVTVIVNLLMGVILLVAWAFVPVLPVLGLALFLSGWMPWIN